MVSNDAKGCYDCIVHTVLQLALLQLGIPKPALQSMIATIQEMDHAVCTAYGISAATYGYDQSRLPPQGILQGNRVGPSGWFAIGSDLLHIMEAAGFGYREWTIICHWVLRIISIAFVDNNDLVHMNNSLGVSMDMLIDEAQAMIS